MLKKLLGINVRTTMTGIASLAGAVAVILNAWRTKDIETIFTQTQTMIPVLMLTLNGLGFLATKDSNVTGAGKQAVAVDTSGTVTDPQGEVLGKQQAVSAVANVVLSKVSGDRIPPLKL